MNPNNEWFGTPQNEFGSNSPSYRSPNIPNVPTPTSHRGGQLFGEFGSPSPMFGSNSPQFASPPPQFASPAAFGGYGGYRSQFADGTFAGYGSASLDDFHSAVNLNETQDEVEATSTPKKTKGVRTRGGGRSGSRGGGRSSSGRGSSGCGGSIGGGSQGGKKLPVHYTSAETEAFAHVWIVVSEDPVVGNNQKHTKYWDRLTERYNEFRPEGTFSRTATQLQSHWKRVTKELSNFQQMYKDVYNLYRSGESGEDMLRRALTEWRTFHKSDFGYLETWHIVKDTQKFQRQYGAGDVVENATKRSKNAEDGSYTSTATGSTQRSDTPVSGDFTSSSSRQSSRPIGTKKAKELAKRGKGKVQISDLAERLDKHEQTLSVVAERSGLPFAYKVLMRPTDDLSGERLENHLAMCAKLKKLYDL